MGRNYIRDHHPRTIASLVKLLQSTSARVCTRVVGALHNLSTNLDLVVTFREAKGIEPLVRVLK